MRAYWLAAQECMHLSLQDLSSNGVFYMKQPVERHQSIVAALKAQQGYLAEDKVTLNPQSPNFERIVNSFEREHMHSEDEVRYVLEGEGIFEVRSIDDCWMRIFVEAEDLIIIPKGRHHRFMLTETKHIVALRLFQEPSGWTPHYRLPGIVDHEPTVTMDK